MSATTILVIIAAAVGCFVAVAIPVVATRREKRRQEEREIRERARQERDAEDRRVKKVKMLARQDRIGDEISESLVEAWRNAGRPRRLTPHRIRHNFGGDDGNYYIDFHPPDTTDPLYIKVWIVVDLRKENKEICICGDSKLIGKSELFLPLGPGEGFINNILVDRIYG